MEVEIKHKVLVELLIFYSIFTSKVRKIEPDINYNCKYKQWVGILMHTLQEKTHAI